MASINDFKLLNFKCLFYFELLEKGLSRNYSNLSDIEKKRFGFYFYMIEHICNIKDTLDIIELITDQDFNQKIFDKNEDDNGVDAIWIDEDQKIINIFNFKFREKFNNDKKQSINETLLTTKFTNAIVAEDTSYLIGSLKNKADKIIDKLDSNDIWKLKLYVVSNESVELDINTNEIQQLKKLYDLEVIPIGLETISKYMSIRPEGIDAILHIDKDDLFPFVENSISSSKSYILKIQATELIRITCDDKILRNKYNIEDLSPLSKVNMEYNLLFDNVRGLISGSKFNTNIQQTLKNEPSKFFMYNNGLTITASDIISEDMNANKKIKLTIKDFQIVNGGQTLTTIHNFNIKDKDNIVKYLSNCEVLLRIFKTPSSDKVKNKIAEYTNSQNAISNIDLKSLSEEQIQIEQFLDANNIIYARKIGDTGIEKKDYKHKISMEKFGQILFSIQGYPEKASTQKKEIFNKYYNDVFGENKFDLNKSVDYIERYFEIKLYYDSNKFEYESTDQKIFYVLYLDRYFNNNTEKTIAFLEKAIKNYSSNKNTSDARKLIQSNFKNYIDNEVNQINNV